MWNPELLAKYEEEMAEKRRRQEAAEYQMESENEIARLRAEVKRLEKLIAAPKD